jgi:hypothetical protein
MNEKVKEYYALKKALSFLLSPYSNGYGNVENKKEKIQEVISKIDNMRLDVYNILTENNPDINKINVDLFDYNTLRSLLPKDSLDSIEKIDKTVLSLLKAKSNILDYNPKLYFDQYFYNNSITQNYISENGGYLQNDNFVRWFGNSVVKDGSSPKVLYHGTGSTDFSRFRFNMFPAMYFAENKEYSEWFQTVKGNGNGILYQCYVRITNPIDLRIFKTDLVKYDEFVGYIELMYGYKLPENKMLKASSDSRGGMWAWSYLRGGVDWLNFIIKDGKFDGIAFYENNTQDLDSNGKDKVTPAWMVFEPNQIKLAKNNSIYSLQSDDIRMKKGGKL